MAIVERQGRQDLLHLGASFASYCFYWSEPAQPYSCGPRIKQPGAATARKFLRGDESFDPPPRRADQALQTSRADASSSTIAMIASDSVDARM